MNASLRVSVRRFRTLGTALAGIAFGTLTAFAAPALAQSSGDAIPVTVAAAVRQDVPILLRDLGAVQAFQTALIRSRVDGTLEQVFFQEGQDLRRGDPLAQIDPRPYIAALEQAQAKKAQDQVQLGNAVRDLARYTNLARNDYASHQQVDTQTALVGQFQATLKGDDATIAAAQVNVDYTNITAPFDGKVGLRQIDPGNVIHAADTTGIVIIAQVHPIAVLFSAPQDNLPSILAAMAKGKLTVYAFTSDDKTLLSTGTLLTTDNMIDATTGTIRLKAVFANTRNHLWPGQFVNVRLQLEMQHNALTVPSIGVQRGLNGLFVYLLKPNSTVAYQTVEVGQDDGQTVIVTKGLEPGDRIVVNGQSRLQDGAHVVVTPTKASS
jgi:multidrug efflux system membrane fusion protein